MLGREVLLLAILAIYAIKANPRSTRSLTLVEPYGTITSPGYPNGYNANSDESWRLRVEGAESYTIYFDVVDLDISGCYDYLVLYNDANYAAPGVPICDKPAKPYVMSASKMTINFNVAGNVVAGERGTGFSLRYEAFGPGIVSPSSTGFVSSTSGFVPSPSASSSPGFISTTVQHSTSKIPATSLGSSTGNPSGQFPPGNQDDSNCGVPAVAPVITGFDYVAQASAISGSTYNQPSLRVVNGEEVVPNSWPWQVSLQGSQGSAYCGGTLIDPQWVVTAAHCAELVFIGTYGGDQALLGAHDKQEAGSSHQLIDIAAKYSHPQYDKPDRSHDVALLRLKAPAELNNKVSLACEAHEGWAFPAGMNCVVTGWGVTTEGGRFGTNILQQAPLALMSDQDCYDLYQQANLDTTFDMQCAGGQGKGACNGDSGGPLNCYVNGRWYHMGIVSFGEANCDTDIASVYAKVAELREFIDSTMALHS